MTDDASGRALSRLHIGAFNCGIEGWINTDITMHLWIARLPFAAKALHLAGLLSDARYAEHQQGKFAGLRYMDLTRPLPFADGSLSAVFSAHVFEHLFPDEVERLAREIVRVLAPGGVCRIVVPDMERIVALYDPAAPQAFLKGVFEIERRKEAAFAHHWGYTRASLAALFREAGCAETHTRAYREGVCPDIDRLDNRPDESIFFEAIK
ncbi:class I SAM-dependent methyltransferase [Bradyrhizobium acaciae]|uniref:class I SAM-dependent methyltransferase n=1 Tax=Bradyrhizobium acaciae TaxID=2683706 RepID=UPI001E59A7B1|nr:methyltransferase domain-containing protein [Bradyrhizobium acaciae]MCC8984518.1 methyltransferase domain-containing protein [Bradyrhizobium acaciae]